MWYVSRFLVRVSLFFLVSFQSGIQADAAQLIIEKVDMSFVEDIQGLNLSEIIEYSEDEMGILVLVDPYGVSGIQQSDIYKTVMSEEKKKIVEALKTTDNHPRFNKTFRNYQEGYYFVPGSVLNLDEGAHSKRPLMNRPVILLSKLDRDVMIRLLVEDRISRQKSSEQYLGEETRLDSKSTLRVSVNECRSLNRQLMRDKSALLVDKNLNKLFPERTQTQVDEINKKLKTLHERILSSQAVLLNLELTLYFESVSQRYHVNRLMEKYSEEIDIEIKKRVLELERTFFLLSKYHSYIDELENTSNYKNLKKIENQLNELGKKSFRQVQLLLRDSRKRLAEQYTQIIKNFGVLDARNSLIKISFALISSGKAESVYGANGAMSLRLWNHPDFGKDK